MTFSLNFTTIECSPSHGKEGSTVRYHSGTYHSVPLASNLFKTDKTFSSPRNRDKLKKAQSYIFPITVTFPRKATQACDLILLHSSTAILNFQWKSQAHSNHSMHENTVQLCYNHSERRYFGHRLPSGKKFLPEFIFADWRFFVFSGINFCDWDRLVFLAGIYKVPCTKH